MDFFMKEGTSFDAPSLLLFITESRLLIKLALCLLPLVKIGSDYVITFKILENWIADNIGGEIFYET